MCTLSLSRRDSEGTGTSIIHQVSNNSRPYNLHILPFLPSSNNILGWRVGGSLCWLVSFAATVVVVVQAVPEAGPVSGSFGSGMMTTFPTYMLTPLSFLSSVVPLGTHT